MEKLKHKECMVWEVIAVPNGKAHSKSHVGEQFSTPIIDDLHPEYPCQRCTQKDKCPGYVRPPWIPYCGCWGYYEGFHLKRVK